VNDFLVSAQLPPERAALADPRAWLAERAKAHRYQVTIVPLDQIPRWHLGDDLAHETRRFFTIEGIAIETNFGRVAKWSQPIIM
jgi:oxidase EvaA